MESNLNHIFELQYALDTFYFLICGALVMWMAAGFAMLEAGLVRAKNTTEILTKNVALFAVACTMYLIVGYDIMYDGGIFLSGVTTVAEMDDAAIAGVIAASTEAGFGDMGEYSGASDFFFQVVFVATAMSIVSGAVAERMKLWAFLAFAIVMCGFIYPMQGSWTWNGDAVFAMYELSYSDYAGSGIVHMAGAAAALAGVLLLGARKGKYGAKGEIRAFPGANLPLATLGTFILWMGWFGFNGGSQLAADGGAAMAITVTHISAAAGSLTWALWERIKFGKASLVGLVTGTIAGLASITPASGFVTPIEALAIGSIAGILCQEAVIFIRNKIKIDDTLDVFAVHGVGGIFGTLMIAVFGAGTWTAQLGSLAIVGV